MGIFSEICMTIDISNNENKNDTTLFHKFRANNRKKRLIKIINNFFLKNYVSVSIIVEFLETYINTIDTIDFSDIVFIYKDEENIGITANFKPSEITKNINITFNYEYRDKFNSAVIKIYNVADKSAHKVPIIYDIDNYFNPINSELIFINEYIKSIIIKYLFERINIGDNYGK